MRIEGGRIDIVIRNDDRCRVTIEFYYTGIGIEPEIQARIFDVFEQGGQPIRARYGGLGLGLAISKRIADLHNGTISVQSAGRDQGSVFTIVWMCSRVQLFKRRPRIVLAILRDMALLRRFW